MQYNATDVEWAAALRIEGHLTKEYKRILTLVMFKKIGFFQMIITDIT